MKLSDVVAVVTGGVSGLGEATAVRLLESGARGAVCLDLNEKRGAALQEKFPGKIIFAKTDVTDEAGVESAVQQAVDRFGGVNVLVNAAAIGLPSKLLTKSGPIAMDKFDKVIKVNLYGPVLAMRACASRMVANAPNADGERGVIINVSSGAAFEGQPGQVAYAASKGALIGMNSTLAREFASYGIRLMTIAPGAFDTPMYDQAPPAVKEGIIANALFPKRMGLASEFAMLVEEIVRNPMHNGRTIRLDAAAVL